MSVVVDFSKILEKAAPQSKLKKLLKRDLSLKKTALSFVEEIPIISKESVTSVALNVVKGYKERDLDRSEKSELSKDPKQLIQRVQNEVVLEITNAVKESYSGERYVWLASDAEEPDPEHQLNYGKIFIVGEGEMPGERIGCRCGMEILVDENALEL